MSAAQPWCSPELDTSATDTTGYALPSGMIPLMSTAQAHKRKTRERLQTEVLIAGAGLTGLTLAVTLASTGVRCLVVDPATKKRRPDPRTTAITCGSRRLYETIGIWKKATRRAQPIRQIRVCEGNIPRFLHFDGRDAGEGPLGHIVPNEDLRSALFAALAKAKVPVEATAVTELDPGNDAIRVSLADGRVVEAELLAAADGGRSPIRSLAGISTRGHEYGQSAISCTIEHEKDHNDTAVELFLANGPFAVLPMPGQKSAVVWTESRSTAEALTALSRKRFEEELAFRFDNMFGKPRLLGKPTSHALSLTLARKHVSKRVVLVGDAAHAIHPIAGQGFNLGLRGIALLAEITADCLRLGLNPGEPTALARFDRHRRLDVAAMVLATDGLNRLFSNRLETLGLSRTTGLGLVNAIPGLKRRLMRHAMGVDMGPAIRLPRLIRGLPA